MLYGLWESDVFLPPAIFSLVLVPHLETALERSKAGLVWMPHQLILLRLPQTFFPLFTRCGRV